ncbi:uncharacterized protein LOC135369291 isoform X1 [Ornithodoros turicata]|uniref:uncharacterized protein LOC135369291 isoform X1 n=1 Tax=Ornithodoros turicata TaxID=34597 RepID=UPI003138CB04
MNPTFLDGLLVFFACLWSLTTASVPCIFNMCRGYSQIRINGALLTCSRKCYPDDPVSCYQMEWDQEPCLNFDRADYGKCYGGVCYALDHYDRMAAEKAPNTTLPCAHGHDYLYNKRGPFACQFYCWHYPHPIANRPDGTLCLRPDTAIKGGCYWGSCYIGYQRRG